jgi:uncharacterized tellurite resistance protein B-like protein
LVHLLVTVDGHIDERERAAIDAIRKEENIGEKLCADFEAKVEKMNEQEIYSTGINLLSNCTDDERLAAFVHLYKLAEADASITNKEVRFLLYGLKINNLSFQDVILSANMSDK